MDQEEDLTRYGGGGMDDTAPPNDFGGGAPTSPDAPPEEVAAREETTGGDSDTMDAPALCDVLSTLSRSRPSADGTLSWGSGGGGTVLGRRAVERSTTLDPSQCAALHAILTRRVSVPTPQPRKPKP